MALLLIRGHISSIGPLLSVGASSLGSSIGWVLLKNMNQFRVSYEHKFKLILRIISKRKSWAKRIKTLRSGTSALTTMVFYMSITINLIQIFHEMRNLRHRSVMLMMTLSQDLAWHNQFAWTTNILTVILFQIITYHKVLNWICHLRV